MNTPLFTGVLTALLLLNAACHTPNHKDRRQLDKNKSKTALLVIDIQNCFLPKGSLPVPNGDQTIAIANKMMELKGKKFDLIVATQDWHPEGHISFASSHPGKAPFDTIELTNANGEKYEQRLWPDHCIQNTEDAKFASDLNQSFHEIILKGDNPKVDSYSGFFSNDKQLSKTKLDAYLKNNHVTDVYILGLATDYCVNFTALDALKLGYNTHLIKDGSRAVDPDKVDEALNHMEKQGVHITNSQEILDSL